MRARLKTIGRRIQIERVSNVTGWYAEVGSGRWSTRLWAIALALALCLTPYLAATNVDAATPPQFVVNGETLQTTTTPMLVEDRLLVSIADFAHLVDGSVHLHAATGVMRFLSPAAGFILQAGDRAVYGNPAITEQPVAPVMRGGEMMVSVRFLADAFGWTLDWDGETNAVLLDFEPEFVQDPPEPQPAEPDPMAVFAETDYRPTDDEMDLFVRVVSAEAPNEPLEGQIAVAAVIINRVLSSQFPDTIRDVLLAPNQFCVISNGQVNRPVVDGAEEAVRRALAGEDPSLGAYFFFAYDRVSQTSTAGRFMYSLPETVRIGVHSFRGQR